MGSSIYILAGNVYNWKVQHNVLHHTYTNIHGHDEDLEAGRILRFSKHSQWHKHHRFQHYYSIFLYGLLTINWAITTDFQQMYRYMKRKLSYGKFPNPVANWSKLVVSKLIYLSMLEALVSAPSASKWPNLRRGDDVAHVINVHVLPVVIPCDCRTVDRPFMSSIALSPYLKS